MGTDTTIGLIGDLAGLLKDDRPRLDLLVASTVHVPLTRRNEKLPQITASDIVGVQPLMGGGDDGHPKFPLTIKYQ